MSGVSVISLVITLLGMAVAPVLANKLGKKNVFLAGIIVAVGGSLIRFIDVRSLLLIIVIELELGTYPTIPPTLASLPV